MSTIVTSNVSDGTLSIPTTYVTNGSAKAWVNFNGTGTVAVKDSLNSSSITDLGTGYYKQNFTTSFSSADYAMTHGSVYTVNNGWFHSYYSKLSASIEFLFIATGGSYTDTSDATGVQHGDLA